MRNTESRRGGDDSVQHQINKIEDEGLPHRFLILLLHHLVLGLIAFASAYFAFGPLISQPVMREFDCVKYERIVPRLDANTYTSDACCDRATHHSVLSDSLLVNVEYYKASGFSLLIARLLGIMAVTIVGYYILSWEPSKKGGRFWPSIHFPFLFSLGQIESRIVTVILALLVLSHIAFGWILWSWYPGSDLLVDCLIPYAAIFPYSVIVTCLCGYPLLVLTVRQHNADRKKFKGAVLELVDLRDLDVSDGPSVRRLASDVKECFKRISEITSDTVSRTVAFVTVVLIYVSYELITRTSQTIRLATLDTIRTLFWVLLGIGIVWMWMAVVQFEKLRLAGLSILASHRKAAREKDADDVLDRIDDARQPLMQNVVIPLLSGLGRTKTLFSLLGGVTMFALSTFLRAHDVSAVVRLFFPSYISDDILKIIQTLF